MTTEEKLEKLALAAGRDYRCLFVTCQKGAWEVTVDLRVNGSDCRIVGRHALLSAAVADVFPRVFSETGRRRKVPL